MRGSLRGRLWLFQALLVMALVSGCATRVRPTTTQTPTPYPQMLSPRATNTRLPTPTGSPSPTVTTPVSPIRPPTASPTRARSPTPSATVVPTLRPTQANDGGPTIDYFEAQPELIDPGDTVTLTWAVQGAAQVTLYKLFYSGQLPPEGVEVPETGSYLYRISEEERNWVNFLLYAQDSAKRSTNAGATVILRCPDAWFFAPPPEDICPTEPVTGRAAEQRFEGGTMVWVASEDAIFVLYDDPQVTTGWRRFEDRWEEGMADRDPELVPPPERQQPIRGFGLIWRTQSGLQERLGWAVDVERGYMTVLQRTTRHKYNAWYLLAFDGGVWYLGPEGSSWHKLPPDEISLTP